MFNQCTSFDFTYSINDFQLISSFWNQLQNSDFNLSLSKEKNCLSKGFRCNYIFYFIEYEQLIWMLHFY